MKTQRQAIGVQTLRMMDPITFEKALKLPKDRDGELSTAALLRAVKEVLQPETSTPVEPNINVIAAELVRDIESANRREKLKAVIEYAVA